MASILIITTGNKMLSCAKQGIYEILKLSPCRPNANLKLYFKEKCYFLEVEMKYAG